MAEGMVRGIDGTFGPDIQRLLWWEVMASCSFYLQELYHIFKSDDIEQSVESWPARADVR